MYPNVLATTLVNKTCQQFVDPNGSSSSSSTSIVALYQTAVAKKRITRKANKQPKRNPGKESGQPEKRFKPRDISPPAEPRSPSCDKQLSLLGREYVLPSPIAKRQKARKSFSNGAYAGNPAFKVHNPMLSFPMETQPIPQQPQSSQPPLKRQIVNDSQLATPRKIGRPRISNGDQKRPSCMPLCTYHNSFYTGSRASKDTECEGCQHFYSNLKHS